MTEKESNFLSSLIPRILAGSLKESAGRYPVVTLLGPRQSGKTTLVRNCFPGHEYCNLEDPELRALALADSKEFLHRHAPPLILDEIQRVPELLSLIQVLVDEQPGMKGWFILTGSHQPELRAGISQSLAGRTSLHRLLPFSVRELELAGHRQDRDEWLFKGCLPRLYQEGLPPTELYRNYYETYIERDVRQLIQLRNLQAFELFMKLLAGRVGQALNLHALSGDIGVSSPTLREWLSVLEASFVVFRLPPYFENFGKRFVKSPKLYFTEPGLAAYLLEIRSASQVSRDPLLGALFENLVVVEALKSRWNRGEDADLYYFRDQRGLEVDLILSRQRHLFPIEIKAARSYHTDFAKNLRKFSRLDSRIEAGAVVYAGTEDQKVSGIRLLTLSGMDAYVQEEAPAATP
ncbi:MAG: ATP-binding protein [Spartobacteria bacterium]|nr:ATP-binding protein [Spartobacteria bacterium]